MNDVGPPENDALVDEIRALRTENQRLRSLLGLDPREPTLIADADPRNLAGDINGTLKLRPRSHSSDRYSSDAKMCTPLVGRARGRKKEAEPRCRWWLGEGEETRSCVPTTCW